MTSPELLEQMHRLAARLPASDVQAIARAIASTPSEHWNRIREHAQHAVATPSAREDVGQLIAVWQTTTPTLEPASVALALESAAYSLKTIQARQSLELVWTGPGSDLPLRRTGQVLREVIEMAQHELIIVSFAVYNIPAIRDALVRAAARGVILSIIIESPQESEGKIAYDGLVALGKQVATVAQVYRWPMEKRPHAASDRYGSLHVKCAVADAQTLFISSANLTEYALTLNMELGVLIKGGPRPSEVAQHFRQLIDAGILVPVKG